MFQRDEIQIGTEPVLVDGVIDNFPLKLIPLSTKLKKLAAEKDVPFGSPSHRAWVNAGLVREDAILIHVLAPDMQGRFPGDDPPPSGNYFKGIPKRYLVGDYESHEEELQVRQASEAYSAQVQRELSREAIAASGVRQMLRRRQ